VLTSFLGPFRFTFSGEARFSSEIGSHEMIFSFNTSEIRVFGYKFEGKREAKEKTYSYFLCENGLAAVNSTATGGRTLMCRI